MKTGFNSFQSACQDALGGTGYEEYCQPVRETAEKITTWAQDTTSPLLNGVQSTWKKTGKHYGAPGQILIVALVAGIAYNLFGSKKKKKGEKLSPLEEKVNRLPPLPKKRRPPLPPRRRSGG